MKSRKSRGRNQNPQLPSHIIETIISKLSVSVLLNLRRVCKAWNNIILTGKLLHLNSKANLFAHIPPHQMLHCIDFDSKTLKEKKINCIVGSFTFHPHFSTFKIINSCNGLLCFVNSKIMSKEHEKIGFELTQPFAIILSPITNEYVELPLNDAWKKTFYTGYSFGFGYSPNKKQYKIVKLSSIRRGLYVADIFTIGTFTRGSYGKWSRVPILIRFCVLGSGDGVYLNGSLYWNGYNGNYLDMRNGGKVVLLRFDVEDEKFEVVSFPHGVEDEVFRGSSNIWIFNNTLYLSCFDFNTNNGIGRFHVWKLMEEGYSWFKLEQEFVIRQPISNHWSTVALLHYIRYLKYRGYYDFSSSCTRYHFQLIKVFEDEKMLFLISRKALILYDSKTEQFEVTYNDLNQDQDGKLWIYDIDYSLNVDSLPKTLGVN
ncbi:hypothetical protein Csa_001105 [Cucumis sativus]|uniref:F-box domain-containing protein n=2 Tax=Cucumis sativus TaxID=3659 RepID=A0A0A0LCB8_CUCSA|nr:hypothetical protein Csa_001105 [Cucumis sativus]